MTRRILIFTLSIMALACTKGSPSEQTPSEPKDPEQESSDQLTINWKPISGYHYYLFIAQQGTFPLGKGNYHFFNQETSVIHPWSNKGIDLYGIALDKRASEYGIFPEADDQGRIHLKLADDATSPTDNDLLIATPRSIECGEAKTQLKFEHAMSQLRIIILKNTSDYNFDIQLDAKDNGYIDIKQGKVIAEGEINRVYFSTTTRSVNIIPQTLSPDAKIYLTGLSSGNTSIIRETHPIAGQEFKSGQRYTWTFSLESGKISFQNFSETLWE